MEDKVNVLASKEIVDEYEEILLRLQKKVSIVKHQDSFSDAAIKI